MCIRSARRWRKFAIIVIEYGGMVKNYDPNALVCMGEEWGWNGFLNSGYDLQNPGNTDRNAHGGWDLHAVAVERNAPA